MSNLPSAHPNRAKAEIKTKNNFIIQARTLGVKTMDYARSLALAAFIIDHTYDTATAEFATSNMKKYDYQILQATF